MEIRRPLFWHQGLFLQPQHFQLADQTQAANLATYSNLMVPHFWGVTQLEFKKAALSLKTFGLISGKFLFPDGTYVEYPGNAVMEDRSFEDLDIEGGKRIPVFIGLRKWNEGGENVTSLKKGDALSNVTTRYVADPDPEDTPDLHGGGPVGQVKKMDYLLKLVWGTEKENMGDYTLIPIAQVERSGAEFKLYSQFIPPSLNLSGSPALMKIVKEIGDQLLSRSRDLEEHKSQRGIHRAEFGSRDMVYLLALRTINRYLPWLRHTAEVPQTHPWQIYGILRQIVGDLSCFSEKVNVMGEVTEPDETPLPAYDHQHLWPCFSAAQKLISRMLDEITAGPDHVVPFQSTDGFFTAELKPSMFEGTNRYFLAVSTDKDHKKTISEVSQVAKISAKGQMPQLISHSLPGLPVEHIVTPPQELPRRSNILYFAIDANAKEWSYVKKDQNLALSWDGAPENLQLELMVVSR